MRDVYRAASEGFRIFGGATEFSATGSAIQTHALCFEMSLVEPRWKRQEVSRSAESKVLARDV
jgi:hypothetical protein